MNILDNLENNSQHIVDDVIAMVTAICLEEIDEVFGTVPYFIDHMASRLQKKQKYRGIRVLLVEKTVFLEINVSIYYKSNIKEVCDKIQESVKYQIESLTDITVSSIDIIVENIVV